MFVGRRQEHLVGLVRARLEVPGDRRPVRPDRPRHALDLEVSGGTVRAVWAVGDIRHELGEGDVPGDAELEIWLLPDETQILHGAGPGQRRRRGRRGRTFTELGGVDGRYLSTEVAGGMTGRMVGVVCADGSVLVRSFEYLGADEPGAVFEAHQCRG